MTRGTLPRVEYNILTLRRYAVDNHISEYTITRIARLMKMPLDVPITTDVINKVVLRYIMAKAKTPEWSGV